MTFPLFSILFLTAVLAEIQCDYLVNWNVSWMAVYNGATGTGTALYYPNGSLFTYGLDGELLNYGTYKIESNGNGTCFEYETYEYPPLAADTCNTFNIYEGSLGIEMIGCEIFGKNCVAPKTCDGLWKNWYAARTINIIPSS